MNCAKIYSLSLVYIDMFCGLFFLLLIFTNYTLSFVPDTLLSKLIHKVEKKFHGNVNFYFFNINVSNFV
jgi:hypothetical protein